ncbi:MAG: hypothetical protein JWO19_3922 [Bryobacterales bacterium]|jgi:hypothetical protein|nr:hypothetical protein [Bryobacterales bacterium]
MTGRLRRVIVGLFLFGVSFGYVEAAVVIYLRTLYEPLRQQLTPGGPPGEVFPLLDRDRLKTEAPEATRLLAVEVIREAATMIMLAAVAMLAAGERGLWLPAFAIAFGVWDISFYLFLKLWIHWPASLMTWDLLFLLPVPWVAPVLAPIIVSITIVGCGLVALYRLVAMRALQWIGMVLGGALVILSFTWDFRYVMAGNLPRPFAWRLFLAGELLSVGAFVSAFFRRRVY